MSATVTSSSPGDMTRSFAETDLPVAQAEHWLWHQPRSVQVTTSTSSFQLSCSMRFTPAPKALSSLTVSGLISGVLSSAPSARGSREKAARKSVEVLGIHHHQESPYYRHVQVHEDGGHGTIGCYPQAAQCYPEAITAESPSSVGEVAGVGLPGPVHE